MKWILTLKPLCKNKTPTSQVEKFSHLLLISMRILRRAQHSHTRSIETNYPGRKKKSNWNCLAQKELPAYYYLAMYPHPLIKWCQYSRVLSLALCK